MSYFALDVHFVHHSREGDALTDVFFTGDPADGSFDAQAEPAMGDRSVFTQVEIPLVVFGVVPFILDPAEQVFVVVLSDRSADDLAKSGGCEHVEVLDDFFV